MTTSKLLQRRDFLKLVGGTAAILTLTSCVPQNAAVQQTQTSGSAVGTPQHGGVLRVAFFGGLKNLDPATLVVADDFNAAGAMYEGLVRIDEHLAVQPVLATAWEVAEDHLSWIFQLRENVLFQHGTPFTAEDVAFTFTRILNPEMGFRITSSLTSVKNVEALDEYTARFNLKTPNPDLPLLLAAYQAMIVAHDRSEEELATQPSGTGPFTLKENVAGDHATFVRNKGYWNAPLPYLDEVRFVFIPEAATQVTALLGDTIDVLWQLGTENLAAMDGNPEVAVIEAPSGIYQPFIMNVTEEPFSDVRVRQALKHCVDRPAMIQAVLQGHGEIGNDQPVSPVSPYWADTPPLDYSIDKAKTLLAEAGYPDGFESTLYTTTARPGMVEAAVALQEMVRPAGITLNIDRSPGEVYWGTYYGQTPFFMDNWPLTPSTSQHLGFVYHSQGGFAMAGWQSPELDQLIDVALVEADDAKRKELYAQVEQLISTDGGVIIPYYKPYIAAARNTVQGLMALPDTMLIFHEAWLASS